jgi:hypothetical protein
MDYVLDMGGRKVQAGDGIAVVLSTPMIFMVNEISAGGRDLVSGGFKPTTIRATCVLTLTTIPGVCTTNIVKVVQGNPSKPGETTQ